MITLLIFSNPFKIPGTIKLNRATGSTNLIKWKRTSAFSVAKYMVCYFSTWCCNDDASSVTARELIFSPLCNTISYSTTYSSLFKPQQGLPFNARPLLGHSTPKKSFLAWVKSRIFLKFFKKIVPYLSDFLAKGKFFLIIKGIF